ncbi:MAG TPA: inositol monophosphatase [Patescibacteria group bacterium]|nr:inositol monophosphatase [Patescibacteria group bacterium]
MQIDVEKVADIIRHVAETEVMPRFKNLATGDIREKNPGDFVTVADEASEKALSAALREYLPGSLVVGEEEVSKDPSVLSRFKDGKPVWVIDPIDGTYNFAHGRSHFGILVALVVNNVTEYGWVYDCPGDRMAIAQLGRGATINGKKAQVRQSAQQLSDMAGMGGGGQAWHFEPVNGVVKEVMNVRSSLHDFLTFAAGEADFVIHLNKVTPWDHSATVLLAEEAGGYVRLACENVPFTPDMHKHCVLIAAPDKARWEMLEKEAYPRLEARRSA